MKRTLAVFLSLLLLFLCVVPSVAHSGGTDSSGGHYDSSTGSYHYHHGYPAHQHTNGKCPYRFKDNTGSGSDSGLGFGGILAIVMLVGLVLLIV